MNIKIKSLLIILIVLFISCKDQKKENELPNLEQDENVVEENLEAKIEDINKTKIIEQIQGKWKEIAYPYRTAEFVDSTVKLVEEGTQNPPIFQQFEISNNCPFENNNIRGLKSGDIILSIAETERCEQLTVSNDTLTLNGFSTNTNKDYNIVYLKLKQ